MKSLYTNKIILSIACLALFAQACSDSSGAAEDTETTNGSAEELVRSVNVEVESLQPQTFVSYIRLIGTVEAAEDIQVASEIGGKITNLMVEKGAKVTKGQAIAQTDNASLLREKERLEAIVSQAKTTYERLQKLYKEEQIGSEIDYLNAKYAFEQAQAALSGNAEQLKKTVVRAPFSGSVENVLIEQGENASPGMPIIRLIAADGVKITAGIPSRYADVVQVGDVAELWFDTESPDTLKSVVTFVGNSIDPFSRTFEIEVSMPSGSPVSKIDMMANLRLKSMEIPNQILLSNEFIFDKDGHKVVYVAEKNANGQSIAKERQIMLGHSYNSTTVVKDGLMPNEELITLGAAFLKDKTRIKIVKRNNDVLVRFSENVTNEAAANVEQ